jgi:hypothetical protein
MVVVYESCACRVDLFRVDVDDDLHLVRIGAVHGQYLCDSVDCDEQRGCERHHPELYIGDEPHISFFAGGVDRVVRVCCA